MGPTGAGAMMERNRSRHSIVNPTIRPADGADAATIAAFNQRLAEETENRTLAGELIGPGVATLLGDPDRGRYFVAEIDGAVVGQLMITYEWSDWRNGVFWWIQSVYVAPAARRNGVFSALYQHVLAMAEAAGACGIRLYVENGNARAQETYRAMGMKDTTYSVMETEF